MNRTIQENIITLTNCFPRAKSDYSYLVRQYWIHIDGLKSLNDRNINLTPCESITRTFRYLVANGAIQLPITVKNRRKKLAAMISRALSPHIKKAKRDCSSW